ncbi:polysaccharide pyruvyl transferase family protein [Fibrobacter sp.]|uniref:polysaccharide pyruvyl transferase family protein n=1 Tax=Fibrobacter sp. TaxID=35828 RepID=UPI00386C96CC
MKIGILTFHCAHNYGAMLQAYALQTALANRGYDAEVVDFRLSKQYDYLEKFSLIGFYKHYRRKKQNPVISLLKVLKNYRKNQKKSIQWERFEFFLDRYIRKSSRIYEEYEILKSDYDVVICGSDQIWNPELTGGFCDVYFGKGFKTAVKRIAYAGSNGSDCFAESDWRIVKKLLQNFDFLSVREQGLCEFLKLNGVPNEVVLDPVFLLEKKDWESVCISSPFEDYVFTYSFWEPDYFFDVALSLSKKMKKKLVVFSYSKKDGLPKDVVQIIDGGPLELLGYIKNASFVVSNSFHGVALSIIMEKQFVCVPPQKHRERIDSIMSIAGITDFIVECSSDISSLNNINYEKVNQKVDCARKKSIEFIQKSLSNG